MNKTLALKDLGILDVNIGSARGRKAKDSGLSYVRDLKESDLDLLDLDKGAEVRPLVKLRQRHHQLARLLADGTRPGECAAITGYAPSTISTLQNDPAFKELMAYYQGQKETVYLDVHQKLAQVGGTALEIIQDRLEENPDKVSTDDLRKIVESTLDRSVAPPLNKGGAVPGSGHTPIGINLSVEFVQPKAVEEPGQMLDITPEKK